MGRAIASVALGYIVMFVLLFITFSAAYLIMGTDRAFQPGSYEPSGLWVLTSIVLSLLVAIAAGYAAAMVARTATPPLVLAGLVVALGLLMAVPAVTADRSQIPARTGDVPNLEAMTNARPPAWLALLNPLIGATGVVIGARIRGVRPIGRLPSWQPDQPDA